MIYIEYISRRPGVALDHFHAIANRSQGGWAESYAEDRLLLNLGRTWRIGREPEYLAVWYTPDAGLERIGDWEKAFSSGEADSLEKPMEVAARLDVAGCYDPLIEPSAHEGGRYYVEFFDFRAGATRDDVRSYFLDRQASGHLQLPVLVDRIGKLGPDPRGVAVWVLSSYRDLEVAAREVDADEDAPVGLVSASLYAQLGAEVL